MQSQRPLGYKTKKTDLISNAIKLDLYAKNNYKNERILN